jgi:hypothetical protein
MTRESAHLDDALLVEVIAPKKRRRPKRLRAKKPNLSIAQILAWADAHYERTGHWPSWHSDPISEAPAETWSAVHQALRKGSRGLPGGSSLPRLLEAERGVRNQSNLPHLSEKRIVRWARDHHRQTGRWPTVRSGAVAAAPQENWRLIDAALRQGLRGLRRGDSLANLLLRRLRVRNRHQLPPLTVERILQWADEHKQRTGRWPSLYSGEVVSRGVQTGENWNTVNNALLRGLRGLPGGSTLATLLAEHRGHRPLSSLPPLSIKQILAWADVYYRQTGKWPTRASGPIPSTDGEDWKNVNSALIHGLRGLPPGSSLAKLLERKRGVRNRANLPHFNTDQILQWADDHFRQTGQWPNENSGPILQAPGETWRAVDSALRTGIRGLPRGSSLYRLLAAHRRPR